MPPVTCPDKLTYYGFSRVFEQQRGGDPVDPAPFIKKALSIEALDRKDASEEELQGIGDQQHELTEELGAEMQESALCTGSIVLSFQGSDFFGNQRPYNSEAISEPFFSGIVLYNEPGTGDMFCAVSRTDPQFASGTGSRTAARALATAAAEKASVETVGHVLLPASASLP